MPSLWLMAAVVVGGTPAAGGANAINMVVDRDIDDVMRRTRNRPLPRHAVEPRSALAFGIGLSVAAFAWLDGHREPAQRDPRAERDGVLRVRLHDVAEAHDATEDRHRRRRRLRAGPRRVGRGDRGGRAPGPRPVRNRLRLDAAALLGARARYRGDYAAANVPMLPVVRGEAETARQIVVYTIALVAISLILLPDRRHGLDLPRRGGRPRPSSGGGPPSRANAADGRAAIDLFSYSISYLTLLFAVAVDALLRFPIG